MNLHQCDIILAPQITEKSTRLADKNKQIVFKVRPTASKIQIKQAVEHLFSVKVKSVNVLSVKGKMKRFGRFEGRRNHWKKAFVSLEKGFDINFGAAEVAPSAAE